MQKLRILSPSFYSGMDACLIAKNLLGKIIVAEFDGKRCVAMIVETEAYMAPDDLACHARGNLRTERTETMFAQGGVAYIYRCYGIHHLLNAVTAPEDVAHAVLIRAVEPIDGVEYMMERRAINTLDVSLTNGPGKLTQAMGIKDDLNGEKLTQPESCLWIGDSGISIPDTSIVSGPRVGMSPLTKEYGHFHWRFYIKNHRWVSKPWHVRYNW